MKKMILFGTGTIAENMVNNLDISAIHCFADNYKAGQIFHGKPIISFEELLKIHTDYDVVLAVGAKLRPELAEQLGREGIKYRLIDVMDYPSDPEIARFKDIHRGKRCFLIGNGPSLSAEDLTVLHEHREICFGCNEIRKIFDKTLWRPNYFVVDDTVISLEIDILTNTQAEHKFFNKRWVPSGIKKQVEEKLSCEVYYYNVSVCNDDEAFFSPDPSKCVYASGTVMFAMIQLSAYMGFSEIYLLGVDGTQGYGACPNEYLVEKRHFYEDDENIVRQRAHAYKKNNIATGSPVERISRRVDNAYIKAEEYTRAHGIRILNATRGGVIETFERVDFDVLF